MTINVKTSSLPAIGSIEDWIVDLQTLLSAFDDYAIPVKALDRIKHQSMSNKRKGVVEQTLSVSKIHPDTFPSTFDLNEFDKLFKFYAKFQPFLLTLQKYQELVEDTDFAIRTRLVSLSNLAYAYLLTRHKEDGSLDHAIAMLKAIRKRSPKKEAETIDATEEPNDETTEK